MLGRWAGIPGEDVWPGPNRAIGSIGVLEGDTVSADSGYNHQ